MFDNDSDNDGIPDISEASSPQITLSNTDADLDGLDDAFNTIISNIDTDNDGVPNYIDLDADNDGIFDLVEARHNLADANNDGIIDNANSASVGTNGLMNTLETFADSAIISYTIADTDTDDFLNFLELDADNDACFDVTEAGFNDVNDDGLLGNLPVQVDTRGKVIIGSYTNPNLDYIISAPIIITTFENAIFCEASTDTISIESSADGFQWEVSIDGTSWSTVTDDVFYNGSSTKTLKITETPLNYNNNRYRVNLTRTGNACKAQSNIITLTVNPLPVLKANPELKQCISADNSNPTVNLTVAEINISTTANVTFEYFKDAAATNQITDPTSYPVVVNATQSVFVKVTSAFNCPREIIELKIDVGKTPDNLYDDLQTPLCDDFLDVDGNDTAANSDTDNITNFSLDQNAIIASINPPINTQVLFYENIEDRNNTLNEIDITNYRNDITKIDITAIAGGIQFPIYYKILSTINNDCQGLGQFYLQINTTPTASNTILSPIPVCDTGDIDGNYTNGSSSNIDLTQRIEELFFGTNQDQTNFEVTFYKSETAAVSGDKTSADYIDTPELFTNDIPAGFVVGNSVIQPIFVRVENTTTGCANPHTSFNVIINPLPIITTVIPVLPVCDMGTKDGDLRNGLAQNIDVSARDLDILGTRNPANFTITYHKTQADLENLASTGIIKNSYDSDPTRVTINSTTKVSEENLFIRIIDKSTGCIFDQSTLTIVVNPEPTFETISVLSQCDNDDDSDDANGSIQTIDLDGKIPEILGTSQNPDDFFVTFHANATDAVTGDNQLSSPHTNSTTTEIIFVRIQNKQTLCVNDAASFEVIINPLPDFIVETPQILCLNDLPLNIRVESPRDVYSYVWENENADIISTDDNADIREGGIYRVTATSTNGTLCERSETIVINESNTATLNNSFITIVDESNDIGLRNNSSIFIDTINNELGPGEYQFAILNTDDGTRTPFAGFQEEPLFENLEGGIYNVIVNDKNGCSPDTTLPVSVIQFPKFLTPNGDGDNDSWEVKGVNKLFYRDASINIFNRYGKLVAQLEIEGQGWDGTYNGKTLSSDDYWYSIQLIPTDENKPPVLKKGNFSLLRK